MGGSKRTFMALQEEKQWHFNNCHIEYDNDPDSGTSAWCDEHKIDVTSVLPEEAEYWGDEDV